jgi:serine/threonine-protein kinase
MSPEQARAEPEMDPRSDIYATGCVLFECLAGRAPFVHRSEAMIIQQQLESPAPDVRNLRPDTPPGLAQVIGRALAKDVNERWQSAEAMREGLGG